MAQDILQHRENNHDWPDDWVFSDSRLDLLKCDDETFLRFLCELVHPVVRTQPGETRRLLELLNDHLGGDGYEMYEAHAISNMPVFAARVITAPIRLASEQAITAEFVKEQLRKCDSKLGGGDYDGAITSSRSLVEGVLGEIFQRCTRERLPGSGNLLDDYKRVKDLLNLSEDQHVHEGVKGLIRSFNGIIQAIDSLSNRIGDRHRPVLKPERHYAKLAVDSAKTIADFLYSTMERQASRRDSFTQALLSALNSNKRFLERKELLRDAEINKILASSDPYLRRLAKEEVIRSHSIDSFRTNDIFFAALRVLYEELTAEDVASIYVESQRNNQMIGWQGFRADLERDRADLLERGLKQVDGNVAS